MKKLEIKLDDNTFFHQSKILDSDTQLLLRKQYEHSEKPRAYCCCKSELEPLELVIAFRRKSGLFELRKKPGQRHDLHHPLCRFYLHHESAYTNTNSNSQWAAMPTPENQYLSDHKAMHAVLKRIVNKTFQESVIRNWKQFKNEVLEYAQNHLINEQSLYDFLNVLRPNTKQYLREIYFRNDEPRILLGELLDYHPLKNKNTALLKIKGTDEPVWFNQPEFREHDLNSLDRFKHRRPDDKRLLILATIRRSASGQNTLGFGLGTHWIHANFNSQNEDNT